MGEALIVVLGKVPVFNKPKYTMAIYVDDEQIRWRGKVWCHLVADSLPELHLFASRLGLRRAWFQDHCSYPHYDVTVGLRDKALTLGARLGDRRTILACGRQLKAELHSDRQLVLAF